MNTAIKKYLREPVLILASLGMLFACGCNQLNPTDSSLPESDNLRVDTINKIIWRLTSARENGNDKLVSILPPFHLIYDEGRFFGDDGCNWFGGLYTTRSDSIFPEDFTQTERACAQIGSFPVEHLTQPYRLRLSNDSLNVLVGQNVYTYESPFTKPISGHPLVQVKNWILHSSSDREFTEIQNQELIPMLTFDDDRTVQIVWSCVPENPFGCDQIAGFFGIGKGGEIIFYQREQAYSGQGPGRDFMQRILASSRFTVQLDEPKGGTLVLTNTDEGTMFEFKAITM